MGEERELANELLDFNDEIEKLINEALNYTLKQMLGLEFSANDADRMRDISERMRNIAGNEKHRDSIRKMSLSDNASSWQKNMAMRAWNNLNQAGKLAGDLDKIRNKTMEEIL